MLYYTQLIFIKKGQEDVFNLFEAHVLPLLGRHNGVLVYRVRPAQSSIIATAVGYPYEVHLITFPTKKDFEAYRDDKERLQYMELKNASVERAVLIEGVVI
jgi:hypothetical protein